jgi:hypothetical protein
VQSGKKCVQVTPEFLTEQELRKAGPPQRLRLDDPERYRFFDIAGHPLVYYSHSEAAGGVVFWDRPGRDPLLGGALKPITPQMVERLIRERRGADLKLKQEQEAEAARARAAELEAEQKKAAAAEEERRAETRRREEAETRAAEARAAAEVAQRRAAALEEERARTVRVAAERTRESCRILFTNPGNFAVKPYQGDCLNGLAHGDGVIEYSAAWPAGSRTMMTMRARFAQGRPHGPGRIDAWNGSVRIRGEWSAGRFWNGIADKRDSAGFFYREHVRDGIVVLMEQYGATMPPDGGG